MTDSLFKPVVVLVGRTNVGKSTLFNRMTRSRDALVANSPGLTRDRHYGEGRMGSRPHLVVDTGGFEPLTAHGVLIEMARQTEQAIAEADVIIFLVDGREGVNTQDHEIARLLRRTGRPVLLAVNKLEGMGHHDRLLPFHELGLGEPLPISAAHGDGVADLAERALAQLAPDEPDAEAAAQDAEGDDAHATPAVRLAVAGRPNVGKSTLVNTLLGEERVVAFDQPGTTRDAIATEFQRDGQRYTLIDTAGLRRRGKVFEAVEKFSIIKTLQAIEAANVVVLLIDAQAGVSDQDAHIAGFVVEAGRALVIGLNKWDALDGEQREWIKREVARKLRFLSFAKTIPLSAEKGQGVRPLMAAVREAHAAAFAKLPTPRLTRVLQAAVERQAPPRTQRFRPKMRYAHQGGQNPPRIIIHGNALGSVPESYRRYLEAQFRAAFRLAGTPLSVEFKSARNPYLKDAMP